MPASVKDVARRAGVSVGTVSNVLNRPAKVAPATVARVLAAVEELGFIRNDAARQLRAGRSRTIGLIVLDGMNPFFMDVARGAESQAALADLVVLVGNSDHAEERETIYLELFEEQRVHGVLISPIGDVESRLDRLKSRGIPAVLVDRSGGGSSLSSVSVDDVAGGHLAAMHLVEIGRTRIAFVGGPTGIRQVADRLEGARRAVSETGVELEVFPTKALSVLEGRAVGEMLMSRPPSARPDGIFAANDLVALGILQSLNADGAMNIPNQTSLIGYDDIGFASSASVALSSMRQPSGQIGQTAVEILLAEAASPGLSPRRVVFQPELVVRQSSMLHGAP